MDSEKIAKYLSDVSHVIAEIADDKDTTKEKAAYMRGLSSGFSLASKTVSEGYYDSKDARETAESAVVTGLVCEVFLNTLGSMLETMAGEDD